MRTEAQIAASRVNRANSRGRITAIGRAYETRSCERAAETKNFQTNPRIPANHPQP